MSSNAGRVYVVTGAASGIGRAAVERLIDDGASVVAVDRGAEAQADSARASASDSAGRVGRRGICRCVRGIGKRIAPLCERNALPKLPTG